MLGILIL